MIKIAICPNVLLNECDGTQFLASATVRAEWIVDKHGNFEEDNEVCQIIDGPNHDEIWTCRTCDAEAIHKHEEITQ